MNYLDDEVVQTAKDGNGAVYRRLTELRTEISRLQVENNKLVRRNTDLSAEVTRLQSVQTYGYQEKVRKILADAYDAVIKL